MKGQALKPSFLLNALPKEADLTDVEVTDEEKHLYSLSAHSGWKVLKEHLKAQIEALENQNKEAISSGMSFEQIGYNSVVISAVKDIIESLFNKVGDAVEAVEDGK